MPTPPADEVQVLEERLGYTFLDRSLLDAALTHPSALPSGARRAAELLEFLGDAVLSLVMADLLLRHFPEIDEGELSKRRSMLVRTTTLAVKASDLGLDAALRLGRGEDRSGGRAKASILAHVYEAVLGAIFRDGGFARVRGVITCHFAEDLARGGTYGAPDWKTLLQERTQAVRRSVPEYRLADESGPAHDKRFTIEVWVDGACRAVGVGSSKRNAEQDAARAALAAETPD